MYIISFPFGLFCFAYARFLLMFFYCVVCVTLNNTRAVSISLNVCSLLAMCTVTTLFHNIITPCILQCQASGQAAREAVRAETQFVLHLQNLFFMWLDHSGKLYFRI